MKAWRQTLAALATLLLLVPAARADEDSDEETAEELEEAAKKAMEEAQRMLERAKARRAEEGKPATEPGVPATDPGIEPGESPEVEPGLDEVAPEEVPPETRRERRLRLRQERLDENQRIRAERRERKLQIRAERRKRKEEIRAERAKIRAERGRPAFYLNAGLVGAIIAEDEDNPITTRDRLSLEGLGFSLRAGGILSNNHMFGVRMQTFVHLTRDIIKEHGGPKNNNMGSIFHFFMGPEYRYITDFNLYFGLSIGGFATGINEDTSSNSWETGDCYYDADGYYHCPDQWDDVRSVLGLGVLGEIGYELRFSYWFAMHFELFGGLYHGWDDEDFQMNNPTIGVIVGIGI